MSTFTKHFFISLLLFWATVNSELLAQILSSGTNSPNEIQASEIEVIRVSERSPVISGIGLGFITEDKVNSGTGNFQWGFIHNADSLYLGHFAPPGNTNSEPYLVYIKCFYSGAVFTNNAQVYDNFNPNFSGIGGVNFVAFIKDNYDEFRTWNGTAWSFGNTNLNPKFSNALQNKNMEVAIPWSAVIPGGGIPDSIQVVCYRTNGNAGGIFSYAQMPAGLPAAGNATPAVNQKFTIKVKEKFSMLNPYRFGQQVLTTPGIARLLAYNPGSNSTTINGNLTSSADSVFTISDQPSATLASKKYSPFFVIFQPKKATVKYEATIGIPNNSAANPFQFKVNGIGKGTADVSANWSGGFISGLISFGENISPNTPVNISITVNSIGTDTAFFSPYISENPTQFKVISVGDSALAPGESTTMVLRFVGAAIGTYTGKIYMLSLSEGSIRFDLSAVVGPGSTPPTIKVLSIPRRFVSIDGNINTGWLGSEAQNSASPGIQWYVAHSPDSLYIGRKGGNNAEPQIVYINGIYSGSVKTNNAQAYDGVSGNLTGSGGLNFVAYLKSNYDEYRNWDGTAWTAGNTGLNPKYATIGSDASMEITIPWSAITNGKGIPDSINLAILQTNGNAGSPFVYGSFPSLNPIGALANPNFNQVLKKEIARPLTETQEFHFGSLVSGTIKDTTLLVYNSSDVDLTSFTNVSFPVGTSQFQLIQGPPSTIGARKYERFKFRFIAPAPGLFTGQGSANYIFNSNSLSKVFKITADVLPVPQAGIQIKIGNVLFNNLDSLRFGNLVVGSQKDSIIQIKNIGNDTLRISSFPISGSSFTIIQSGGTKLSPGDSTIIKIRFIASVPIGSKTGFLTINTNAPGNGSYRINLKGISIDPPFVASTLEIRNIANNPIFTSGVIPPSQLSGKALLSDNAGIKWFASWDTTNLYVVKLGGNRAQPQIIYLKASYPGAVFTDVPTYYDGFHPGFTGIGGINFIAYFKETAIPYDEFRNWNGTLWLAPSAGLQPQYGNDAGQDIFAVRIPWNDITQGNGVPDSLKLVMYQTNANPGNFVAYGQSPAGLPSGNAVTPPVNLAHTKKIITRLPKNSEFDFGNVPVGTSVDTTFLLQNEGPAGSNVVLNGPATITGSAFSAADQTSAATSIPSKKWGFVKVRFTPTALGNAAGSLTANATFTNPTAPYTINFKGNGINTPAPAIQVKIGKQLVALNSFTNLGIAEIGTQFDTTLSVVNNGQDTLRISGAGVISGIWTFASLPKFKIAPGDSSNFKIRKASVKAGADTGYFSLGTNVTGISFFRFSLVLNGDSVLSWSPSFPTINDSILIKYNPAFGNKALAGETPIFIHTGVITSGPTGTGWQNVQGSFNVPADSVKLDRQFPNKQGIKFRIKDFYNLTGNPTVYRLGMVFRNGNGSKVGKTKAEGDFFIPINPVQQIGQIVLKSNTGIPLANNSEFDFGSMFSQFKDSVIILKNQGNGPLNINALTVSGTGFSLIGTTPNIILPGDSLEITIRFTASAFGVFTGQLNIQSNSGTFANFTLNLKIRVVPTAIEDQSRLKEWVVYPNPASERIEISNPNISKEINWHILDLNGKSLMAGKSLSPISVTTRDLPNGMYFVRLVNGQETSYKKLIKR